MGGAHAPPTHAQVMNRYDETLCSLAAPMGPVRAYAFFLNNLLSNIFRYQINTILLVY